MIRGVKLLLETPGSRQTNFQYDQKGVDAGGTNGLIHPSEGDISACFIPFMGDVKTASSILVTLTSLEQ